MDIVAEASFRSFDLKKATLLVLVFKEVYIMSDDDPEKKNKRCT